MPIGITWIRPRDGGLAATGPAAIRFTEEGSEPYELFCAEPYSQLGYFHPGDRGGKVRFPDVALHFRARNVADPVALLRRMAQVGEQLAARLGAVLLDDGGQPFELAAAEARLQQVSKELRALQDAERSAAADRGGA